MLCRWIGGLGREGKGRYVGICLFAFADVSSFLVMDAYSNRSDGG